VTTARSFSRLPRDLQSEDPGTWPVLARIPDLSADARPSQRPSRPATPTRPSDRRFDAAKPRAEYESSTAGAVSDRDTAPQSKPKSTETHREIAVGDASHNSLTEQTPAIDKHAAHLRQPPAHHLNQRAARTRTVDEQLEESSVLPNWNPFANPSKRLPETFAPILSFLVMVALFTAAGTCILLLRSAHRHSASDSPAATPIQNTAAAPATLAAPTEPTAIGPLGPTASRLLPADPNESTHVALPEFSTPKLTASTSDKTASGDAKGGERSPAATPANQDYPATQYPEYPEPEFPATNEIQLPQANATGEQLPVARFSGQILEAPTRQAKNDDQSILH
jgi:hypothetical protein